MLESCIVCQRYAGPNTWIQARHPFPGLAILRWHYCHISSSPHCHLQRPLYPHRRWLFDQVSQSLLRGLHYNKKCRFVITEVLLLLAQQPRMLLSDNGLNFTSQVVTKLFKILVRFLSLPHLTTQPLMALWNELMVPSCLNSLKWPPQIPTLAAIPRCHLLGVSNQLSYSYWAIKI